MKTKRNETCLKTKVKPSRPSCVILFAFNCHLVDIFYSEIKFNMKINAVINIVILFFLLFIIIYSIIEANQFKIII